jgi:hypothetical protein
MPRIEGLADVVFHECEAWLIRQMSQVFARASGEVINANNLVAFTQQAICKVRAKKTGSAGDNHTHSQEYMPNSTESAEPSGSTPKSQIKVHGSPSIGA